MRNTVTSEVKNQLKQYGSLSSYQAIYKGMNGIRTTRLGAYICALRKVGWDIETRLERVEVDGRSIIHSNYILLKAGL